MVEASVDTLPEEIVNIQLVDEGSAVGERLLYRRPASPGAGPTVGEELDVRDRLFLRAPLEMPGREWSLLISPTPKFVRAQSSWESVGFLAVGLLTTAFLVAYLISMINDAAKTERLAAKLAKSNQDLETRNHRAGRWLWRKNRRLALAVAKRQRRGILSQGWMAGIPSLTAPQKRCLATRRVRCFV